MNKQTQNESIEQRRTPRWWRAMSVVIVALVFGVLMRATLLLAAAPAAPVAVSLGQSTPDHGGDDDFISRHGIIMTRPVESVGTWVIGSKSYSVTESTVLEGSLEQGTCAEVKTLQSDPSTAVKIESKEASKCDGNDDDDDSHDDDFISRHGIIMTRPVESVGTWVIGSKSYSVTESTVLEGSLEQGTCVEVKTLESDPSIAVKIESKEASKCDGNDDDDDDGGHHSDDDFERYGRLESRPAGKEGTWVIGGESYTATASTELDQDHGALVVGICTKVHVLVGDPTVAREIESAANYKCGGRDDDNVVHGMLFGVVEQLPLDLQNGTWVIGGLSFVVSPTTELISKGGTFTVGLTVKVDFTTNISDTNFARRIEIKFGQDNPCRSDNDDHPGDDHPGDDHHGDGVNHNGGDDDSGYGYCPGHEGKTFGIIDSRPDGSLIGDWMIGGVPYITTASTRFHADDDFLAGERVKVEYVVLSDNMRRITKMMESDNDGGVSNPNHSLIVGYVDAKPEAFVGDWTINGAPFVAMSSTVFIERGSIFAKGAYVVVEYEIVNDQRVIIKILTYVPPGAGDDNKFGRLEGIGGAVAAGTDATLQNGQIWTVDGVDYIVSEATQLVDNGGDLVPGAVVYVNSYTDDGQRYATMIRTQGGKAFIPMALR